MCGKKSLTLENVGRELGESHFIVNIIRIISVARRILIQPINKSNLFQTLRQMLNP